MRDRWGFIAAGFIAGAALAMLTTPDAPPFAWFIRLIFSLMAAGVVLRLTISEEENQNN